MLLVIIKIIFIIYYTPHLRPMYIYIFLLIIAVIISIWLFSSNSEGHLYFSNELGISRSPPTYEKFMVIIGAAEGIAGWINCIREASLVAKQLGRTLVEPCVKNGALIACEPGRVFREEELIKIQYNCLRDSSTCRNLLEHHPNEGKNLPLSAYFDWEDLQRSWAMAPMIKYHDWEDNRVVFFAKENESIPSGKLIVKNGEIIVNIPLIRASAPFGTFLCVGNFSKSLTKMGKFTFSGRTCPLLGGLRSFINVTAASEPFVNSREIFVSHWTRTVGNWMEISHPTIPLFNKFHYTAVRAWIRSLLSNRNGSSFAVLQWRSVMRTEDEVSTCTTDLINASLALIMPNHPSVIVLVADLPAPGNKCGIWDHFGDDVGKRKDGVQRFYDKGFFKYDEHNYHIDAGILSIRDMILASEADSYMTCSIMSGFHGDICRRCFWPSSYIAQVVYLRNAAGKKSILRW